MSAICESHKLPSLLTSPANGSSQSIARWSIRSLTMFLNSTLIGLLGEQFLFFLRLYLFTFYNCNFFQYKEKYKNTFYRQVTPIGRHRHMVFVRGLYQ